MELARDSPRTTRRHGKILKKKSADCTSRTLEAAKDGKRAGATHALSCGVPDRESNEVHYLQDRNHLGGASTISSPAEVEVGSVREFIGELVGDAETKNM